MMTPAIAATTPATMMTSQNVMWIPGKFGLAVSRKWMLMSLQLGVTLTAKIRHDPGRGVRTEQEEGDIAEIEQAGKADDDVESECEQRIHGAQDDGEDREEASGVLGEPQVRQALQRA